MYEKFTDRSRKVMQLAQQEAKRFNHEYVGTEHILLGLVKEGSGVAANVLKNLEVDLRKVRLEVEKLVLSSPDAVTADKLPQTPRAKKVIEYSIEAAQFLGHNYIGTEHILLGLLKEQEGIACQVLMNLGVSHDDVREETLNLLGTPPEKVRDAGSDSVADSMLMTEIKYMLGTNEPLSAREILENIRDRLIKYLGPPKDDVT